MYFPAHSCPAGVVPYMRILVSWKVENDIIRIFPFGIHCMLRFIPLIFLLISICPVLSAKEIAVGQLVSDCLDTESSTNVAFNVRRNDVKVFDVRIEQASSVSNCVQVAFGRDADADGDLSPDEADLVLGWRAGRYFVEDVSAEERTFEPNACRVAYKGVPYIRLGESDYKGGRNG